MIVDISSMLTVRYESTGPEVTHLTSDWGKKGRIWTLYKDSMVRVRKSGHYIEVDID